MAIYDQTEAARKMWEDHARITAKCKRQSAAQERLQGLLRPGVEAVIGAYLDQGLRPATFDSEMEEYANRVGFDKWFAEGGGSNLNTAAEHQAAVTQYQEYLENKKRGKRQGKPPEAGRRAMDLKWYTDLNVRHLVDAWLRVFDTGIGWRENVHGLETLGEDLLPQAVTDERLARALEGQDSYLEPQDMRQLLRELKRLQGGLPKDMRIALALEYEHSGVWPDPEVPPNQ